MKYFTDITYLFPSNYSKHYKYLLVLYYFEINAIVKREISSINDLNVCDCGIEVTASMKA